MKETVRLVTDLLHLGGYTAEVHTAQHLAKWHTLFAAALSA